MGDGEHDFERERLVLRELLSSPSFRLVALPGELERSYVAHQRALARRNIQRFWPLVILAFIAVVPMAISVGVVRPETFGVITFGVAGLALPIAAVVIGNLMPRFERAARRVDVSAAFVGLSSMHVLTTLTESLPEHRSIAEHAVILVTLATCTIANLSFRSALSVCLAALAVALSLPALTGLSPNWTLFPFYAIGSIAVGSIAGVTGEIRERTVFLQERLLALEKRELDELSQELAAISRKDALTELPNRRHFDEILEREWSSCAREQAPLGVLFIDVDFFKRFNDLHGHQAGDECLRAVGRALGEQALRGSDFVARYGGEEFVGLFPRTEPAGMDAVAQRFLDAVDELAIPHEGSGAAPHVTVSIGVTSLVPSDSMEPEELLRRADAALYRAKEAGRHRYVSSIPEPERAAARSVG